MIEAMQATYAKELVGRDAQLVSTSNDRDAGDGTLSDIGQMHRQYPSASYTRAWIEWRRITRAWKPTRKESMILEPKPMDEPRSFVSHENVVGSPKAGSTTHQREHRHKLQCLAQATGVYSWLLHSLSARLSS